MQEKGAHDPEIAQGFDSWRSKCLDPNVNLIDEFHEMMLALEPPIFTQINHEFSDALSDVRCGHDSAVCELIVHVRGIRVIDKKRGVKRLAELDLQVSGA